MAVWSSPGEVPADLPGSVVTIGVFDAVHRGHQTVIRAAARRAAELGLPVVAVTFDPNPLAVVRPDKAPSPLTTVTERARLLREAGADHVLVLPFTRDRSEQLAPDFIDDVLVTVLKARAVVVGEDFRFGYRAKGDVELLRSVGARAGFEVEALAPVGDDSGTRWSSTAVRSMLAQGDVAGVVGVLGRFWTVDGVVVRGDRRGRELGFPTANVPTPAGIAVPLDGVYAGWLELPSTEEWYRAAISVGENPTFEGASHRVEAYVLDRDDLDLYGHRVVVHFVAWIRGQQRFDSLDELVAAMNADVAAAREALRADGR
ncbi:bifunctional riboflavin kinase/FAD synthetase [Actinobacteria bacterium YIM 96077]|uniref:Riboflavin biosynthesis protein n=1 Tax=Phytoactinopolyspora halophila TaxID=1981511 RepID=A0A329QYM4_9ACTN|nr:bifunctional riboflavin kinase/FAD synthetase [Phytoactinopolyspora halophila]AYY12785.1 bifunctional riboflavin kinase/FAD synthetase [Actinobacteria bacterium YIM 96077]RAW16422.1 bifunctional riboflavin kinase/FAD synthetase [Phytoactinopolyspora halophila]